MQRYPDIKYFLEPMLIIAKRGNIKEHLPKGWSF